jgi:hypothetical protein
MVKSNHNLIVIVFAAVVVGIVAAMVLHFHSSSARQSCIQTICTGNTTIDGRTYPKYVKGKINTGVKCESHTCVASDAAACCILRNQPPPYQPEEVGARVMLEIVKELAPHSGCTVENWKGSCHRDDCGLTYDQRHEQLFKNLKCFESPKLKSYLSKAGKLDQVLSQVLNSIDDVRDQGSCTTDMATENIQFILRQIRDQKPGWKVDIKPLIMSFCSDKPPSDAPP